MTAVSFNRMAEAAMAERTAFINAEMVDRIGAKPSHKTEAQA